LISQAISLFSSKINEKVEVACKFHAERLKQELKK
jgi:hypothetical protein